MNLVSSHFYPFNCLKHIVVKECPFCEKPTRGRADNMFKLYIKIGGGAYFCHRCGAKGSWFDFKRHWGRFEVNQITPNFSSTSRPSGYHSRESQTSDNYKMSAPQLNSCSPMPNERLSAAYISALYNTSDPSAKSALQYLTEVRGISRSVLRKYGVGLSVYQFPCPESGKYIPTECISFPWIMRGSEISEQETLKGQMFRWRDEVERRRGPNSSDDTKEVEEEQSPEEVERRRIEKECGPWMIRRIKARAIHNKAAQRLDPPGMLIISF